MSPAERDQPRSRVSLLPKLNTTIIYRKQTLQSFIGFYVFSTVGGGGAGGTAHSSVCWLQIREALAAGQHLICPPPPHIFIGAPRRDLHTHAWITSKYVGGPKPQRSGSLAGELKIFRSVPSWVWTVTSAGGGQTQVRDGRLSVATVAPHSAQPIFTQGIRFLSQPPSRVLREPRWSRAAMETPGSYENILR